MVLMAIRIGKESAEDFLGACVFGNWRFLKNTTIYLSLSHSPSSSTISPPIIKRFNTIYISCNPFWLSLSLLFLILFKNLSSPVGSRYDIYIYIYMLCSPHIRSHAEWISIEILQEFALKLISRVFISRT